MTSQKIELDKFLGAAIRKKRLLQNKSLKGLGDILGITFQQMQKYEKGTNRLPCAYIFEISKHLNCSVESFFPKHQSTLGDSQEDFNFSGVTDYEVSNLIKHYSYISSKDVRKKIIDLVKTLDDSSKKTVE